MDGAWEAVFRLRLLGGLCLGGGTRIGCGAGLGGAGAGAGLSPVISRWSYPLGVKQFYLRLWCFGFSSLRFIFIPKKNGAGAEAGLAGEVLVDDT